MVLNAAVQMLREADELKQKILKFKSGTSMLQERSLWITQQQLQKIYQKVLVLDLDYALEKKVEQDLWNVGFKQQIEALQAISKDRKSPLRGDGQAMLSWVLQAAAGFYLCLLHQICTTFKLDLPFRRRASLLGWVEGWGAGAGAAPPPAARYITQHCLVHLGDLARYRQQLRVAHTFYRHALVVSAHSGQPYNQLALVAWRRGRRLGALYWHVRSLLVRAPFPPAPANLARTLHAAASGGLSQEPQPVLSGVPAPVALAAPAAPAPPADGSAYVTQLIRAMHLIHTVEHLDTAEAIVKTLNAALPALISADGFEAMTLIKMTCVVIWLVHSASEDLQLELESGALSEGEATAAQLSGSLAAGMMLALALAAAAPVTPPPSPTEQDEEEPAPPLVAPRALPALKVWLQWCVSQRAAPRAGAWGARALLWPALAAALNELAARHTHAQDPYEWCPLPEDEELQGFTPLDAELSTLRFAHTDAARADRPPDHKCELVGVGAACPGASCAAQVRVRAARLLRLGRRLAQLRPDHIACTEEDGEVQFSAVCPNDEALAAALSSLGGAAPARAAPPADPAPASDSDDEPSQPLPRAPIIISEADFREKVREKRVGILKPQGSLERAREERAMASTQDDVNSEAEEEDKSEDKKEARKPRVNIAMAAIMRKQEETNKQVKFITPPPTPDSTVDTAEKEQDKPKMIQPKAIKGIVTLPLGRKTGGILSLKDKSAGYPHLVNTDPEPAKKADKDDKKEPKPSQSSSQNSQTQQKPHHAPPSNWNPNPPPTYSENPRMNFQKNYGIQNAGITYNPHYPSPSNGNQGIRLPVVNPKEIDVRSAALQKQSSRTELFTDAHKLGPHQLSGDKKNFLNDLPPRFANQYRYWHTAQDNHFNENKFRDDNFKNSSLFNQPSWPPAQDYQPPAAWWKDTPPPTYNANFNQPMNMQPNFYSYNSNLSNPYQAMPFNQMQTPNAGQTKEGMMNPPNYLQSAIGQPQIQSLQSIVNTSNFNSSLNNYGGYGAPSVGYDATMYPQFGKLYPPYKERDNSFGNTLDAQRNVSAADIGAMKNLDAGGIEGASGELGNMYSLFSGADQHGPRHAQQSLWSGPGPSPLERLLEQQKQMKQPPPPQ